MSLRQSTKTNFVKNSFGVSLAFCLLLSSSAFALEGGIYQPVSDSPDSAYSIASKDSADGIISNDLINSYAQNDTRRPINRTRSQSEVIREVKRRYDAEVLKITLNQQGSAYRVRILMPSGRVRQITVSATR